MSSASTTALACRISARLVTSSVSGVTRLSRKVTGLRIAAYTRSAPRLSASSTSARPMPGFAPVINTALFSTCITFSSGVTTSTAAAAPRIRGLRHGDVERRRGRQDPWAMPEVRDLPNASIRHPETDDVRDLPRVQRAMEDDDCRLAVQLADDRAPRNGDALVLSEVLCVGKVAGEAIGDIQPSVGGDQLAQTVAIVRVEALDVELHEHLIIIAFRARRLQIARALGELRPSAIERGLHTTDRRVDEIGDLLERVVEHVLEEHARALLRRKEEHEMLARRTEVGAREFDCRDAILRLRRLHLGVLTNLTPAQKVDAAVVRDAKEPGRERARIVEGLEPPVRLEESLLHDVLAVQNRSSHTRAVAMQPRTQARYGLEEGEIAWFDFPFGVEACRGVHAFNYAPRASQDTCLFGVAWVVALRAPSRAHYGHACKTAPVDGTRGARPHRQEPVGVAAVRARGRRAARDAVTERVSSGC